MQFLCVCFIAHNHLPLCPARDAAFGNRDAERKSYCFDLPLLSSRGTVIILGVCLLYSDAVLYAFSFLSFLIPATVSLSECRGISNVCNDLGACFAANTRLKQVSHTVFKVIGANRALLPIDEQSTFDFVDPLLTVCFTNRLPLRN